MSLLDICTAEALNSYHNAYIQGRPLGGANGALAPGADFEGAPKRQSPTGHTLKRMVISSFANEKSCKGFLFLIWLYWF
jgi:hypothetical protein